MAMDIPDYARIIAEDTETLNRMRKKEWRTIVIGLPIIRRLLNGEDVTLGSFKVSLIPDDVLFNARPRRE